MIRRNVDLIAITFLLAVIHTGSLARYVRINPLEIEAIRPRVMEIRRELIEARGEVRNAREEVRREMREAIQEAAGALEKLHH